MSALSFAGSFGKAITPPTCPLRTRLSSAWSGPLAPSLATIVWPTSRFSGNGLWSCRLLPLEISTISRTITHHGDPADHEVLAAADPGRQVPAAGAPARAVGAGRCARTRRCRRGCDVSRRCRDRGRPTRSRSPVPSRSRSPFRLGRARRCRVDPARPCRPGRARRSPAGRAPRCPAPAVGRIPARAHPPTRTDRRRRVEDVLPPA